MRSNVELDKKIEHLETLLNDTLDTLVDELVSKKLDYQGIGNLSSLTDSVTQCERQSINWSTQTKRL